MLSPATAPAALSAASSSRSLRLALAGNVNAMSKPELQLLAALPPDLARGALRVNATSEAAFLRFAASAPLLRVAQSRPPRRELAAASVPPLRKDAVEAAVGAAVNEAVSSGAAAPSSASRLADRPQRKPGSAKLAAPSSSRLSADAVEGAIAAAIEASPAPPGGIALSALRSSPLPPRAPPRGASDGPDAVAEAAAAQVAALSPVPATAPPAVDSAALEAESAAMAERRRLDDELQREVEARIRARASADARIEAQQRAAAEARARAQAAAEERAAAASRKPVRAAEIDDEPELIAAANGVSTSATVASNATVARGMDLRRTVLIGVIGAGPASRGLIRLRNGRIVTVRLGDKIDGGTITSIGNSRVTYVKSGRPFELKMLDGR